MPMIRKSYSLTAEERQRIRQHLDDSSRPKSVNPKHVAIIPDGNRRWAKDRGLDPWEGHWKGAEVVERLIEWAFVRHKIPVVSIYSLSIENVRGRSPQEIQALSDIYVQKFREIAEDPRVHENEIQIRVKGALEYLSEEVVEAVNLAMDATKGYKNYVLNCLMPYGGKQELVDASRRFAEDVLAGRVKVSDISEELFSRYLLTAGLPDPDLIIRTAEKRMSNFLLWQTAYAEVFFLDKYWPDFNMDDLSRVLGEYSHRQRNFGR
jgi:tritrans,polycis-undecaprenyl-diphosphate synthase [geranylgeranyl-diphosphate specific]